jgi:glucuronokinase
VGTLRALMDFYGVEIPRHLQPSLALSVETEELGIVGGLQDRVIQVYGGLVYMDFARDVMRKECGYTYGVYEPLDPAILPSLYLAYSDEEGEPTEATHGPLRIRYERGDRDVLEAMKKFADLAERGKAALLRGDIERLSRLMDENFDTRRSICDLQPNHVRMVETARSVGASAKFAGSGGAIVGVYTDEAMFGRLKEKLEAIGCRVFKPLIE